MNIVSGQKLSAVVAIPGYGLNGSWCISKRSGSPSMSLPPPLLVVCPLQPGPPQKSYAPMLRGWEEGIVLLVCLTFMRAVEWDSESSRVRSGK